MVRHTRLLTRPRVNPGEQGALLVEALVVSVVVTLALLGTIGLINISTQQRNRAGERNQLNAAIDADLAAIEDRSADLTCCSGACTLGIPGGTTPGPTSPCATDNRRDDRYFYPQLDSDPASEGSEAQTVDATCDGVGILAGVLDQFTAIPLNADLVASGGGRAIALLGNTNRDQNILQVTYTDNNAADPNAPVRVARVVPPMARFCP